MTADSIPDYLVLYDGECGLCDKSVQWLLERDAKKVLSFAPLQGSTAQSIRKAYSNVPVSIDTIVYIEHEQVYLRSRAAFAILKHVPSPLRHLRVFRFLPATLTDLGYRFVAAIRYKVWGRLSSCRIPTVEERARFLP